MPSVPLPANLHLPWRRPKLRTSFADSKLRGVNLGGWLILERWMTPSVFEGRQALDEYSLCIELGINTAQVIGNHHQTYITDEDIAWIASQGLNAVRLPVPHWVYGDHKPYIACDDRVAWLLESAQHHGIGVLIDLHTAPGSQNGQDHSGRAGKIGWNTSVHRAETLAILKRLTRDFGDHPALIGIEVLNEPHKTLSLRGLQSFYRSAATEILQQMPQSTVVVSDSFRPRRLNLRQLRGLVVDMHLYQAFGRDTRLSIAKHIDKARREWGRLVADVAAYNPAIVGEWSLGLDPDTLKDMDTETSNAAMRSFAQAQLDGFAAADGWFFWSYKTEADHMPGWSYRQAVERGWMPSFHDPRDTIEAP